MKLHLPTILLASVISALSYVEAATSGAYYVLDETSNTVQYGGTAPAAPYGTYTFTTGTDGTVVSQFVGNAGRAKPSKTAGGSDKYEGTITGLSPKYDGNKAAAVEFTIGDGVTETKVSYASGGGINGQVVTGNKTITVKENATVGNLAGAQLLQASWAVKNHSKTDGSTKVEGYYYSQSASSYETAIKVENGTVGTLVGGLYVFSSPSEVAGTQKEENGPEYSRFVTKDKVNITVSGDKAKVGTICGAVQASVDNEINITIKDGATVENVYAGTYYLSTGNKEKPNAEVKSTTIELNGANIEGNVYAGGNDKRSEVSGNTKIILKGTNTLAEDSIVSGGGSNDAVVKGDSSLEVDTSHSGEQEYNLADFNTIKVSGDLNLKSLKVAEDADGTSIEVNEGGSLTAGEGVLTGLKSLEVEGTLTIDVTNASTGETAVSGKSLTLGDAANINIVDNSGSTDSISLFGFDDMEGGENLTLTMNGQAVSNDMWDFSAGGIVIKELSAGTLSLSGNQSSFYQALQAMNAAGAADAGLAALAGSRDSEAVRAQIDMLSGHELATAMMSQVEGNMGHMRRLRAAIANGPALDSYTTFALCSPATDGKGPEYVAPQQGGKRWRAGVQAYHEDAELDASSKGDGYDRSETGAMLTAEYFVNKSLTVGGALSCGRTTLKSDNASKRHEDNTSFDAFALYGKNRWQFATALGLGLHQHDLKRTYTSAEADGYSINFMQDVAYTLLVREKSNVQAFATLASSWNLMDGYTEKGAYALHVDDQDSWTTDVTMGARYNHALPALGAAPAGVFSVQAGVTGTLGDVDSETEMSLNGFRYNQKSASRDRWGWSVGASVDVPVRSNMSWYAAAEAVMRSDYTSVDGQVGVKLAF